MKMLSKKSGATLEELVEATGWLPHTARAALTGLRKRGYTVLLERQDGKPSLYRIAAAMAPESETRVGRRKVKAVHGRP